MLYLPLPDDSLLVPWACSDPDDAEVLPIPVSWLAQRIPVGEDAALIASNEGNAAEFLPRSGDADETRNRSYMLCPVRMDDRIIACLLLTDSPLFPGRGGIGSFLMSLVSEISGPLLSRLFRQNVYLPDQDVPPASIAAMVDEALHSVDQDTRSYLVVLIALPELLQRCSAQSPYLYGPTVERYLRAILASIVREIGSVYSVQRGSLLLLSVERGFDSELLMQQLVTVLRSVFLSPPEFHHLVEHIRVYPKDGSNAKELLAGIL